MMHLPTISKPRLSISSTHRRMITGTEVANDSLERDCIDDDTESQSLLNTLSKSAPNKLPIEQEKLWFYFILFIFLSKVK